MIPQNSIGLKEGRLQSTRDVFLNILTPTNASSCVMSDSKREVEIITDRIKK